MRNLLLILIVLLPFCSKAQWQQTTYTQSYRIEKIVCSGSEIYAGRERGVVYSSDNGASWVLASGGLPGDTDDVITALCIKDSFVFAGVGGQDGLHDIFRTSDKGQNWVRINNGIPANPYRTVCCFLSIGNTLYTGAYKGIYVSTDNGNNWTLKGDSLNNITVMKIVKKDNLLFAATNGIGVYKSTNMGETWEAKNNGLNALQILSLEVCGNNLLAGTYGGIYLSTNNGDSWISSNTGLPDFLNIKSLATYNNYAFVGSQYEGVYLSNDGGFTWYDWSDGLSQYVEIISFGVNETDIFAGSYGGPLPSNCGIWKRSLGDLVSIENRFNNNSATNIYPNPAKDELKIKGNLTLFSLYNNMGVLVLETKQNELDVSALPSGIYFAKVISNGKMFTEKIEIEH